MGSKISGFFYPSFGSCSTLVWFGCKSTSVQVEKKEHGLTRGMWYGWTLGTGP